MQILCTQIKIPFQELLMPFEQLKLENQLCHRLYMASNSITRAYREPLAKINLTYPQYIVMMALWEQDQITIAKLIEKTAIDGGALTQILKKMTEKKLLSVVKDKQDQRKRLIQLSTSGQALKLNAADIPKQIHCKFESIDSEKALQLLASLDLVIKDLNEPTQ